MTRDPGLVALPAARSARTLRVRADQPVAQLAETLAALDLPLKQARCMVCGGALVELAADAARERAPAGALRATDRFWTCERCGRLLWRGSHWRRIAQGLAQADARRASGG